MKKVTGSHTKKQTVIIAEKDIPKQELKNVVAKAGYDAVSVVSLARRRDCFWHSEGDAMQSQFMEAECVTKGRFRLLK